MIVVDANVVIAALSPSHAHHRLAVDALATDDGLAIHPLTLAEVLVGGVRGNLGDQLAADIRPLGIDVCTPGPQESLRLAQLRVDTNLRMPDCCVLYAATATAAAVATFDTRLAGAARTLGLEVVGRQQH